MHIRSTLTAFGLLLALPLAAEPLPSRLVGTWKITRVLPVRSTSACWDDAQAQPLVGSSLVYRDDAMKWRGGEVPVQEVVTRSVSEQQFRKENSHLGQPPEFAQLGIRSSTVTEVDLQHEDAEITGTTTEVPGDSVLLVAPNRIVVSACGVYFEATRSTPTLRASARR